MKLFQSLSLAVLCITLTACGPAKKPLSVEAKESLKTVAIDSNVVLPEGLWFHGSTQTIASNFGAVGSLIGDEARKSSEEVIEATLEQNNVSVSNIVRAAFRNEMAKHTPYKPLDSGANSDANLVIRIDRYGFEATGLSEKFRPNLVVIAEMHNSDGEVIWRNKGVVTSITKNNDAIYTYREMMTNADVMRDMLQTAANMVAKDALIDL